jgi:hypothetical protein
MNLTMLREIIRELVEESLQEEKVLFNNAIAKIEDTEHSRERKRRDNNEGAPLTDKEITSNLIKALPKLKQHYRDGLIPENEKVWLYNPETKANIVIEYHVTKDDKNKIKILTVMRVANFRNSKDTTLKIEI